MAIFTVENPEGRRIKFEWTGSVPPTDADIEEVFASAGEITPEPLISQEIPSDIRQFQRDIRVGVPITQAQAPPIIDEQRAITPQLRPELPPAEEAQIAASRQEGYRILGAAAFNTPASAFQFVKDTTAIIRHPIQTAKGIKGLSFGLVGLLLPGEQKDEATARAMGGFLKDRYGSVEAILDTFENDPVGFLSDISVLFTGGGALAAKAGRLSTLGKNLQTFGKIVDPVSGLGLATSKLVTRGTPINSLIKTALELPKKKGLERIDNLANAFLNKGLNVNRKSLKVLDNNIKKVRNKINGIVDSKTKTGVRIRTAEIVDSLDELIDNAGREGLEIADLKIVRRMREQFAELHGEILTPRQVQDIKVGFNKGFKPDLDSRFGQVRSKVRDKLRSASKSQLEELHPDLKALNANEGVMIELSKAIEDRIIKLEKQPVLPTKGLIVGGLAGGITGGAAGIGLGSVGAGLAFGAAAFVIADVISDPRIQVRVARAIHKNKMALAQAGKLSVVTRPAFQTGRATRIGLEETPTLALETP